MSETEKERERGGKRELTEPENEYKHELTNNMMKINTSSKYSHCFDKMGRSTLLMVFHVSCQLRCHYHRKRLNQLPDYSIHIKSKRKKDD